MNMQSTWISGTFHSSTLDLLQSTFFSASKGCSGCGVVIKGVDRDKWITINKIAVLLRMCTAIATEMVGVCVPTGIQHERYQSML